MFSFEPLHIDEVMKIADLLAEQLKQRLKDQRITLQISSEALAFIAKAGYDPVYGARPLKRYLQRELETRIARAIIGGDVVEGGTLTVGLADGVLCVTS